jgi:hypothetical protein
MSNVKIKFVGFGNANSLAYGWIRNLGKLGFDYECHAKLGSLLDDPLKKYPKDSREKISYYDLETLSISNMLKYFWKTRSLFSYKLLNQEWVLLANIFPEKSALLLTGTEIDIFADYKKMLKRSINRKFISMRPHILLYDMLHCFLTRRAIAKAKCVIYFLEGLEAKGDRLLKRLRPTKDVIRGTFMDNLFVEDMELTQNKFDNSKINIVCSARHNWKRDEKLSHVNFLDFKDTNLLIEAFYKIENKEKYHITLFEKGVHVEPLKRLIQDLGLEHYCTWLPEVDPNEFYSYVKCADIVVDNLGPSALGMGTFESMLLSKPVLTRIDKLNVYKETYPEFPLKSYSSVNLLCEEITRLACPKYRKKIGFINKTFAHNNISIISQLVKLLNILEIDRI